MYIESFFSEALAMPTASIAYHVSRGLAEAYPGRAIVEGHDIDFDLDEYARAGLCALEADDLIHHQVATRWCSERGVLTKAVNAWYEVAWRGHRLEVVLMDWDDGCCQHFWIIAGSREVADAFFGAVCAFTPEVRDEVLVFDGGSWVRSEALFRSIRAATFDNLVLEGTLRDDLRRDVDRFFASRELYESHGIPWKRGLLLVGPPGNGKTHAVKAIVNAAGRPCLYVKSFDSERRLDKTNVRLVFDRARRSAPCLMVLEDLDSHIDDENRSFFLNELDGFAENRGVLILATTNHPERLDPAILDRPSRFDRKYHFGLPGLAERRAYLSSWSDGWPTALRLDDAGKGRIAAATAGFSFAYIKELCLSSMMRWVEAAQPGAMEPIMAQQVAALRLQMGAASAAEGRA